jgi:hypothetical protein
MASYILERFEDNDWAVLECDGEHVQVPKSWLPQEAKEGDVLRKTEASSVGMTHLTFAVDVEQTKVRREKVNELRASLPKGPKGDLEL